MVGCMKKNIITIAILIIGLNSAVAQNNFGEQIISSASGDPSLVNLMQSEKLPQPDSGITIVPSSELSNVAINENQVNTKNEYKINGYEKTKSDDAIQLLSLNKDSLGNKKSFFDYSKPNDTHLKHKLDQIKLAFNFHEISFINEKDVLGYAPGGTMMDGGWTAVSETFRDKKLGICDYFKLNLKIGHGAARLAKENVTYDINNNPTLTYVEGNDQYGYAYKVSWFDDTYYHTVKCATKLFDRNELKEIIELSKRIDIDQQ